MEAPRSRRSLVAAIHPLALVTVAWLASLTPALAGAAAAPPGDLWAAQTSPTTVTLVWTRLPKVAQYRIYQVDGEAFRLLGKAQPSGDRYIVTVGPPWGARRFAVEAVFEDGATSEKGLFNEVRTVATSAGAVDPPPSVAAEQTGPGEITVTWPAVPDATAYMIGRSVSPGGFQMLCSLCPATARYVDHAATPGSRHTYSVVALAARGGSRRVLSNVVTASDGPAPARATPLEEPSAARGPSTAQAPPAAAGAFRAEPRPGACLSLGLEGNLLVRLADGTVQFYERARVGRKGLELIPSPAFRQVAGVSDAVAVATSGTHSLVLRRDGTILAWGENTHGQIGSERAIQRKFRRAFPVATETPLLVDGIAGAVAVAAGHTHSVALLADGTIRTWGNGERGIPGDGRLDVTTNRLSPAVVAEIGNAVAITGGSYYTLALLSDHTVRGWGHGGSAPRFFGGADAAVPLRFALGGDIVAIASGGSSGVLLLADGTVRGWRTPSGAYRGDDDSRRGVPVPVPEIRNAVAVSGYLILLADGTVREIEAPGRPVPGVRGAVAVASDHVNRYALLEDGRLLGWGHRRWWPKGVVEVRQLGRDSARECAAGPPRVR